MAKKAQKSRRSKKKKKFTPRSVRLRSRGAGSANPRHLQAPPALVEKLREFEAQADAYWAALPKISDKDRAAVDRSWTAQARVAAAPAPIGGAADPETSSSLDGDASTPAVPNRLLDPKELFDQLREDNPRGQRERPGDYAWRLHGLMEAQRDRLRYMWLFSTVRRELYRKP